MKLGFDCSKEIDVNMATKVAIAFVIVAPLELALAGGHAFHRSSLQGFGRQW